MAFFIISSPIAGRLVLPVERGLKGACTEFNLRASRSRRRCQGQGYKSERADRQADR
jgi:hypothetical protein